MDLFSLNPTNIYGPQAQIQINIKITSALSRSNPPPFLNFEIHCLINNKFASVSVADRLTIFPYQLAHFHGFTLADYCTYNMGDLLLCLSISRIRYTRFKYCTKRFFYNYLILQDPDPSVNSVCRIVQIHVHSFPPSALYSLFSIHCPKGNRLSAI